MTKELTFPRIPKDDVESLIGRFILLLTILLSLMFWCDKACAGIRAVAVDKPIPSVLLSISRKTGISSWYADPTRRRDRFFGRRTASGERVGLGYTVASREFKLQEKLLVCSHESNKCVVVRVNDRGPYFKNRKLDLAYTPAKYLNMIYDGIHKVSYVKVNKNTKVGPVGEWQ